MFLNVLSQLKHPRDKSGELPTSQNGIKYGISLLIHKGISITNITFNRQKLSGVRTSY